VVSIAVDALEYVVVIASFSVCCWARSHLAFMIVRVVRTCADAAPWVVWGGAVMGFMAVFAAGFAHGC
jgi:hypothetical protein